MDPASLGGSPAEVSARLLEGGQRALEDLMAAIRRQDPAARERLIPRASAWIEEMMVRLDHEAGGELVQNLSRVYEWWLHELLEGAPRNELARLDRIAGQMGAMREAWVQKAREDAAPLLPGRPVDGEA